MKLKYFLLIGILFSFFSLVQAQQAEKRFNHYLDQLRSEYLGSNAFETVAFVEQFWRHPGNTGFDTSIYYLRDLLEKAGYVEQAKAQKGQPHYRIESYKMNRLSWEPIDASLKLANGTEILNFTTNRNMLARNSFSTKAGGIMAEVIRLKNCNRETVNKASLEGKIVMADCSCYRLFDLAVNNGGALGVMAYSIPGFNHAEQYQQSISFSSIPHNPSKQSFAILLSYAARQELLKALEEGKLKVKIEINTKIYPSEELCLIAEIPGKTRPDERFVFSAHVQEPGANDNASGVGAQAEMARVAAQHYFSGEYQPDRSLSFLWGDEIRSTRRFIQQDKSRAKGIKWGMSLDMVGENTEITGGTFLIEKMPDPSAIWTRGEDKHTEWGAARVSKSDFNPHYFNDYITYMCHLQGKYANWEVNTNPYEGGSDHQPFLDAKIPGLLLWHFTDVFYHTDQDRIDKVSAQTLQNVGISALASAMMLTEARLDNAQAILEITKDAAVSRLQAEYKLSKAAYRDGKARKDEAEILPAWGTWYQEALGTTQDLLLENNNTLNKKIEEYRKMVNQDLNKYLNDLK